VDAAPLLHALLTATTDAVLLAGPSGGELEILSANPAAGALLGGEPASIVGGGLLTRGLVGAETASRTALRLSVSTGYPFRGGVHLCRLDGQPFGAHVDLSPIEGGLWLAVIRPDAESRAAPLQSGPRQPVAAPAADARRADSTEARDDLTLAPDGAPDLALVWDAEDRLVGVGGAPETLLPDAGDLFQIGRGHAELMRALAQRRVFDVPLASTSRFLADRDAQHRLGGGAVEQPVRGHRWLRMTEQRLPDGGAVSLWSDVSKYRWLEQTLSETEDRIRAVATNAPIVLFATDRSGNLTLCEGKGLAALGVKADWLVGQSIHHRMRRYPVLLRAFDQAMAGTTCAAAVRVGHRHYDCWLAPSRGRTGRIVGVIGVATDVTRQRQAETAARDSEQRFVDVVRAAAEVIWELNAERRFSFVSDNCQAVLGAPAAVFVSADPMDLVAPDARMRMMRHLALTQRRPRAFKGVELPLVLPDGRAIWLSVSGVPTFDAAGRLKNFRGAARDVTAQRQAAERLKAAITAAQSANRAKSEFLANVSHELRTPLNAVIGFSEIMCGEMLGPLHETYKDYARDINNSGKHLLDLINDVLDLSKAEAGRLDLADEMLDLEEVVEASLRFVRERAEQIGVHLDTRLPEDLPRLLADERKVKQILINLLTNSVKFTEPGGRVAVVAAMRPAGGLALAVSDTGIGIKAEDIPKALATFGQVDSSLSRKHEGTGLGLPLCKALIERHGGTLDIESEPGKGTTVTVVFPPERVVGAG